MARILVVDDCSDTAESAAKWLQLVGHDVRIAYDGYDAIDLARRQRPEYVLLDLGLPRLDGYQVASRLRQQLDGRLVIIAITGNGQAEDRRRALDAGCDYYFLKPVDLNALMPVLSAAAKDPDIATGAGPSPEAERSEKKVTPTSGPGASRLSTPSAFISEPPRSLPGSPGSSRPTSGSPTKATWQAP